MDALTKRPTEALTGPALGLAIFGFCTQVGLSVAIAGPLAVAAAFGPLLISQAVDAVRR